MASTPGPLPPMRARTDDQEHQPTPKKLKSEVAGDKPPRRAALRDVTNELHGDLRGADAKKQPLRKPSKPRVAGGVTDVAAVGSVPEFQQDASHDEAKVDESVEEQMEKIAVDPDLSRSESAPPCATQEELLAFEHLIGHEEENQLAEILYERLREQQTRHRVATNYFEEQLQPHLNAKMRSILVDWLIDVHYRLKLHTETLFLAINYLDRYLKEALTTRSELQLVGVTCLFIAAKFEEVEPVDLSDLIYVTDKTYTGDQIIAMERKVIEVLGFNLSAATAHAFVDYFTHTFQSDRSVSLLAAFFTQSMLLHLPFVVCYPPAVQASAAVFLAQCVAADRRPNDEWIVRWEALTMTCYTDMLPCIQDLCTIMAHPSKKLTALRTKFSTKRFGRVANKSMDNMERFL